MTIPSFDCTSCNKFQAHNEEHPERGGSCHALPPVPALIGADKVGRPMAAAFFPSVGKKDWCMSHPLSYTIDAAPARPVALEGFDLSSLRAAGAKSGNGEVHIEESMHDFTDDDDHCKKCGKSLSGMHLDPDGEWRKCQGMPEGNWK